MKRKLSTLKQDPQILDLRPVNPLFVSRYRQAMRAGDVFPPLIVDREGAIIAGNHRYEAAMAEFGENHTVEVVAKSYRDDAERIEDAIRDNARHGNALDGITRKRAILRLSELGRKPEAIGTLLGISVKRVEEMAGLSVLVVGNGGKSQAQPVKRGLEHMAGRSVSADQYETHRNSDRGVPAAQSARQLIRWIGNDWIDWQDDETRDTMIELAEMIRAKI